MSGVPVIDLTAARQGDLADRKCVARQIDEACCDIGFFTIAGHGVAETMVQDLRAQAAHAFFALPLVEKLRAAHPEEGNAAGVFHALAGEALALRQRRGGAARPQGVLPRGSRRCDVMIRTSLVSRGRQFFLPNVWPAGPASIRRGRRRCTTGRWIGWWCSSCNWPPWLSASRSGSSMTRWPAPSGRCASTTIRGTSSPRPPGSSGPAPTRG